MRRVALLAALLLSAACVCAGDDAAAAAEEAPADSWFSYRGHNFRQVYDPESKKFFFQNLTDRKTSWVDPRPPAPRRPRTPAERRRVVAVLLTPFALFFGALWARVQYLRVHAPELLAPTKERKVRKVGWGRSKVKTGSNRMSQDGKGGRSANS